MKYQLAEFFKKIESNFFAISLMITIKNLFDT